MLLKQYRNCKILIMELQNNMNIVHSNSEEGYQQENDDQMHRRNSSNQKSFKHADPSSTPQNDQQFGHTNTFEFERKQSVPDEGIDQSITEKMISRPQRIKRQAIPALLDAISEQEYGESGSIVLVVGDSIGDLYQLQKESMPALFKSENPLLSNKGRSGVDVLKVSPIANSEQNKRNNGNIMGTDEREQLNYQIYSQEVPLVGSGPTSGTFHTFNYQAINSSTNKRGTTYENSGPVPQNNGMGGGKQEVMPTISELSEVENKLTSFIQNNSKQVFNYPPPSPHSRQAVGVNEGGQETFQSGFEQNSSSRANVTENIQQYQDNTITSIVSRLYTNQNAMESSRPAPKQNAYDSRNQEEQYKFGQIGSLEQVRISFVKDDSQETYLHHGQQLNSDNSKSFLNVYGSKPIVKDSQSNFLSRAASNELNRNMISDIGQRGSDEVQLQSRIQRHQQEVDDQILEEDSSRKSLSQISENRKDDDTLQSVINIKKEPDINDSRSTIHQVYSSGQEVKKKKDEENRFALCLQQSWVASKDRYLELKKRGTIILASRYFDYIMFFVIVLNALCLALYDYTDGHEGISSNLIIDKLNFAFTAVYICEALILILVWGVYENDDSYIRSGWNVIDITVVITGILEMGLSVQKHKTLRAFRVLRPLKSIKSVRSIKKLIKSLIFSAPDFANVGMFLIFVFILFATMGLHQYNGDYYNQCRYDPQPENSTQWLVDNTQNRVCSKTGLGNFQCPSTEYCGNPDDFSQSYSAKYDMIQKRSYINYGITTFDNIGSSLLSVFQMITCETWQMQLYNLMDADIPFIGALFSLTVIIVGQFFLLNLILAVIIQAFIKIQKKELEQKFEQLHAESNIQASLELEQSKANVVGKMFAKIQGRVDSNDSRDSIAELIYDVDAPEGLGFQKDEEDFLRHANSKKPAKKPIKSALKNNKSKIRKCRTNMSINSLAEGIKAAAQQDCKLKDANLKSNKKEESKEIWQGMEYLNHEAQMQQILKPLAQKRKIANMFQMSIGQGATTGMNGTLNAATFGNNDIEVGMLDLPTPKGDAVTFDPFQMSAALALDVKKEPEPEKIAPPPVEPPKLGLMGLLRQARLKASNDAAADDTLKVDSKPAADKIDLLTPKSNALSSVKSKLQGKVNSEYEKHLAKVIKDAKETYEKKKGDPANKGDSLRQLVGLKFCIEVRNQLNFKLNNSQMQSNIKKRAGSNRCYRAAYLVSLNYFFNCFIILTVVCNMIMLSLDKYPIQQGQAWIFEIVNFVCAFIYTFEFLVNLCSVGFKNYFKGTQRFNIFDSIIVILSICDVIVSYSILQVVLDQSLVNGIGVTILRSTRLLRLFKLARRWKRFELLLETLGKTLIDVGAFSILLFLFIFTYTLLGLEFFAEKAKFDANGDVDYTKGTSPSFNFDNFMNSIFTVFIILTNDSQSTIYYNYYRAVSGVLSTVFWVSLVVLGQKVLLNLFLAFLLENFDEGTLKEKMLQIEEQEQKKAQILMHGSMSSSQDFGEKVRQKLGQLWEVVSTKLGMSESHNEDMLLHQTTAQLKEKNLIQSFKGLGPPLKSTRSQSIDQPKQSKDIPILFGTSLWCFNVSNKFRQTLFSAIIHKRFDYVIIFFILVSALQLGLDSPLNDPNSTFAYALILIDAMTTVVFILESVIKIIALGFALNGPWSYLRQSWNILDFIIILMSTLSLTPLSDKLKSIKMLRIFRALRLVTKNDGLKVAVRALFLAIPNVANVTIIMILFFFIFGVISVSYFKGKLYYCTKLAFEYPANNKWDCIDMGGEWVNQVYTFDDIPNALVTLFVMATTAGWSEVVVYTITSTDIDFVGNLEGAYRNPAWLAFYVVFMLVGCFFFLNLFVGVVVSTFNTEHDKLGGNNLLTDKQKEWIDLRLLVLRSQPIQKLQPPKSKFRQLFFDIHENKLFHNSVMICIILNTLVLTLKWYQQPVEIYQATEYLNYIFTGIFIIEAFIKIVALGIKTYFSDGWNIFDFVVMAGTFASIFISLQTSVQIKGATTVFRAFRILRILRLLKRGGKSLSLIFNTFVITLHSLVNIGGLLLVFIYMYSILGMIVFGDVKRNGIMNSYLNFENFTNAFITLFTVATGDSWNYTMAAFTMDSSPMYQCIQNASYDDYVANNYSTISCGDKFTAYIFFVSYHFVVNLVFLKLFIAIILQGYSNTQQQDERLFNIDMNDRFREVWSEFDPDATTFLSMGKLRGFLLALGEPLGFDSRYHNRKFLQDRFIVSLDLPTYHNFSSYQYLDVLDALSFRLMVLDHIKKTQLPGESDAEHALRNSDQKAPLINVTHDVEKQIKDLLSKEVNRLIFQKKSENITAVKEVWEKELKKIRNKEENKDKGGFTSSHQMAAEIAVRRMKAFLIRSRKQKFKIENVKDQVADMQKNKTYLHFKRIGSNMFSVNQTETVRDDESRYDARDSLFDGNMTYGAVQSGFPMSSVYQPVPSSGVAIRSAMRHPQAPVGRDSSNKRLQNNPMASGGGAVYPFGATEKSNNQSSNNLMSSMNSKLDSNNPMTSDKRLKKKATLIQNRQNYSQFTKFAKQRPPTMNILSNSNNESGQLNGLQSQNSSITISGYNLGLRKPPTQMQMNQNKLEIEESAPFQSLLNDLGNQIQEVNNEEDFATERFGDQQAERAENDSQRLQDSTSKLQMDEEEEHGQYMGNSDRKLLNVGFQQ